jgi:MFS family permease
LNADISLYNWMQSYDLICADPDFIALMSTMFFTGMAIFSPILPALSDKYGRKWFFVGCLTTNIIVFSTILLLPAGINPAET